MAKNIQLTITEPCHENWESMTTVQKGKFCDSCQKQVIDFSTMSDRQIAEFFKKPSTGSVCGRFMTDQLDRSIETPRKRIPWIRYFFQIALPAFLFSVKSTAQKTHGVVRPKPVQRDTIPKPQIDPIGVLGMVMTKPCIKPAETDTIIFTPVKGEVAVINMIKGQVVDEKGNPVPFASIQTGQKNKGVMADELGYFSIKESALAADKKITVSAASFASKDIIVAAVKEELRIVLTPNVVLQEVVLVHNRIIKGKVLMGAVTRISASQLEKVVIDIPEKTTIDKFQVFPNPVTAGSNITISINKQEQGYYTLQLFTMGGQQVEQKTVWVDGEARLLSYDIPNIAPGTYLLVFINKETGKKMTTKIIVS